MNRVRYHHEVGRDLKPLVKKYRKLEEDLRLFDRLILLDKVPSRNPYAGIQLNREGRPAQIFKARALSRDLQSKSGGLRYVWEELEVSGIFYAVVLTIYVHQLNITEQEVKDIVRTRHADLDVPCVDQLFAPLPLEEP